MKHRDDSCAKNHQTAPRSSIERRGPDALGRDLALIWRQLPGLWLIPIVIFVAAIGEGTINEGPVLCIFRRITDLRCPGCGFTRSFVAAMQGYWSKAHDAHLLGIPLMLCMAAWWSYACACLWRHRWPRAVSNWLWGLALAIVLGGHLWRVGILA